MTADTPLNPFDDDRHTFRVLANDQGQHSLWPEFADVPSGWQPVHGPAPRVDCLAWVDTHWTTLSSAR